MRNQTFIFSVSNILQFTFRNDFYNSLHMQNIFHTAPNLIDIPRLSCIGTNYYLAAEAALKLLRCIVVNASVIIRLYNVMYKIFLCVSKL